MPSLKENNKSIFEVFFREKPAMMLVELKNANSQIYASVLAKQIDYEHNKHVFGCTRKRFYLPHYGVIL